MDYTSCIINASILFGIIHYTILGIYRNNTSINNCQEKCIYCYYMVFQINLEIFLQNAVERPSHSAETLYCLYEYM